MLEPEPSPKFLLMGLDLHASLWQWCSQGDERFWGSAKLCANIFKNPMWESKKEKSITVAEYLDKAVYL